MPEDGHDLVVRLHREAIERIRRGETLDSERPERPRLEFPNPEPGSPLAEEWALFRREVERLVRDGHEGRFALVVAGHPITVWDTLRDAASAGRLLFPPGKGLIQEIQLYFKPLRQGCGYRCRV